MNWNEGPRSRFSWFLLAFLLLLLIPLQEARTSTPQESYEHARQLFLHGHLERSQQEAERGYKRLASRHSTWASKFQLLEAAAMVWRGMYENALGILSSTSLAITDPADKVERLTLEAVAYAHLHQFATAENKLREAERLCSAGDYLGCGAVIRAGGNLAVEHGDFAKARVFFLASLSFARAHHDLSLESTALLNLGFVALQNEHYDEAVDWSEAAYRAGLAIDNENEIQGALGNLGWAYFELGDTDRALDLFIDAEKRAGKLGNIREQLKWLTTAGYVYQESGDLPRALRSYNKALELAQVINSKQDIIDCLEDLAHVSADAGKLNEASAYIERVTPLIRASGSRLDELYVMLAQAKVAAARHQHQQAESLFRVVERDPASQTSMRLVAEHALAQLYESEGNNAEADRTYRNSFTTYETARAQLKNEDSRLPFLANASAIYDDYIQFLVARGKRDEALTIADQSRARTLLQGLGLASDKPHFTDAALQPQEIARKTNATLLFYWLGEKQSYLWAITQNKTAMFPLPSRNQIAPMIARYRKALLGLSDPAESSNPDGLALYSALIAPARDLIPPGSPVIIFSDGILSQLNFETLIEPGPTPRYFIEDATLISAPSLFMLASAKPPRRSGRKLLLLGDAISPNPDYPALPKASMEMAQVQQHFALQDESIFAREHATAGSYLTSTPQQFAFIHFVAHGVASRTDPLDSAIILSRSTAAEDSFKLHAREIIQHPIHAQLVTISACYGSGERSFAGEGLVGLAWAFLRAGAHNVIGALWEVSDESTPRLMDNLYQGLQDGMTPGAALRQAKLTLLHSKSEFRKPFFWAPLQVYTGL